MAANLKTIVIGTALTEGSDDVVRTGLAVARATGASPWLVHAYLPPAYPAEVAVSGPWLEDLMSALQGELAAQAERTGLAALPGFTPEQLVLKIDSPSREIVDLAQEVQADLIVVGATEGGSLHRLFLGSTADGVVRRAPCPILVVRDAAAFPPTRVEIPVDLSPVAADSCRQGLDFLREIGVPLSEVEAFFVLHPFETGGSIHFSPGQVARFASEELGRFLEASVPDSIPRLSLVRTGYPRDEILATLRERKADLAILGTHGRGGFERLMIGSVTAEVMHQARCNLLIVPPGSALRHKAAGEARTSAAWRSFSDETPVTAGLS